MEVKAEEIYTKTGQQPIAVDIVFQKWVFFGHVLRQNENTPANRVMQMYFQNNNPEGIHRLMRSYKKTLSLPTTLVNELIILDDDTKREYGIRPNMATLPMRSNTAKTGRR